MSTLSVSFTILRLVKWIILGALAFALIYAAAIFVLSRIPKHAEFRSVASSEPGLDIWVRTNGVHTDIILPIQSSELDWGAVIPMVDLQNEDLLMPYISVGWGDKGFYLETPAWKDLKARVAFKAAFGLSGSAMHVEAVALPQTSDQVQPLRVSHEQYRALTAFIKEGFELQNGRVIKIDTTANYNQHDAFYEAHGRYSLFTTCNEWTREGLDQAGIRTPMFSPLASGVMDQLAAVPRGILK